VKILFIGGVKSGKSKLAEAAILALSGNLNPYYLATTECLDEEMQARIAMHRLQRQQRFITLEEPVKLLAAVQQCDRPVLVECITMWLNNMLYHTHTEGQILQELEAVLQLPGDMVLVHNEVGYGIVPDNRLARQFVDLSGKAAQLMAANCGQVYFCSAGLKLRMK
jgi:adenosylcobinamide kinase/adenosylcobinamide-phosphate guanylyltransferase